MMDEYADEIQRLPSGRVDLDYYYACARQLQAETHRAMARRFAAAVRNAWKSFAIALKQAPFTQTRLLGPISTLFDAPTRSRS